MKNEIQEAAALVKDSPLISSQAITESLFNDLERAQYHFDNGEEEKGFWVLQAVESRVKRAEISVAHEKLWVIMIYTALFLMVCFFTLGYVIKNEIQIPTVGNIDLEFCLTLMLAATVGACTSTYHYLSEYLSKYEYDPQHALSYFVRPLLGALIGLAVFIVQGAGLLAFGFEETINFKLVLIFFSAALGYKEYKATELLNQWADMVISKMSLVSEKTNVKSAG